MSTTTTHALTRTTAHSPSTPLPPPPPTRKGKPSLATRFKNFFLKSPKKKPPSPIPTPTANTDPNHNHRRSPSLRDSPPLPNPRNNTPLPSLFQPTTSRRRSGFETPRPQPVWWHSARPRLEEDALFRSPGPRNPSSRRAPAEAVEETPPPYHEIEEAPPGYAGEREGRGQGDDGDRGERRGRERERRVEVRRVYTYAYLRTEVDEEVSWADFGEE